MTQILTWLHFSDVHYCEPRTGWDAERIHDALIGDLKRLQSDENLQPDLIFFTGDAAFGHVPHGPHPSTIAEQFSGFTTFMESVRKSFRPAVRKNNVFLVPGNHDVNRTLVAPAIRDWLRNCRDDYRNGLFQITRAIHDQDADWKSFIQGLDDFRAFLKSGPYQHLLDSDSRLTFACSRRIRGIRVAVVGLNSAWTCGSKDQRSHIWLAGKWQIQEMKRRLTLSPHLSIALVHHPPDWLVENESVDVDLRLRREFDFCLHGHTHQGSATPIDNANGSKHFRIAAGACYTKEDEANRSGYNIVRLDLENGTGEIWFRRFADPMLGEWTADTTQALDARGVFPLLGTPRLTASVASLT